MSSPSAEDNSSRDAQAISSVGASATSEGVGTNPIWLLVAAAALFFAFGAAVLASG
jgi:hypothetical protein